MEHAEQRTGPRRTVGLTRLLLGVVVAHAAIILTPELFRGSSRDLSPEEKIEAAREMERQERYEEALELYTDAMRRKPEVPPIWLEAEREITQVRIKAEQQRRRLAEATPAATNGAGVASSSTDGPAAADGPAAPPPIDLPKLPDIGEF